VLHKVDSAADAGVRPSLQRVDLSAEGADPVLLQNADGFLGLVHRNDDYGLPAFPEASSPDALTMDGNSCTVRLYNLVEGREIHGYCHYLHQCPGHICQTLR
jgi:hypothetical protein